MKKYLTDLEEIIAKTIADSTEMYHLIDAYEFYYNKLKNQDYFDSNDKNSMIKFLSLYAFYKDIDFHSIQIEEIRHWCYKELLKNFIKTKQIIDRSDEEDFAGLL